MLNNVHVGVEVEEPESGVWSTADLDPPSKAPVVSKMGEVINESASARSLNGMCPDYAPALVGAEFDAIE